MLEENVWFWLWLGYQVWTCEKARQSRSTSFTKKRTHRDTLRWRFSIYYCVVLHRVAVMPATHAENARRARDA
jgi:hypothetical protein